MPPTRFGHLTLASLIVLLAVAAPTPAQSPPTAADPPPAVDSVLEAKAFTADTLGLTMHLPLGSHVALVPVGEEMTYRVSDAPQPRLWRIRLERVTWSDPQQPAPTAADAFLELILGRQEGSRVILRETTGAGGVHGSLGFVERTFEDGQQAVHGWVVLPSDFQSFVVLTISVTPEFFPDFKPLLDQCLGTLEIRSEAERSLEHRERIGNGRRVIESATPEHLRSLVGLRQWFRMYRPIGVGGNTGETELACSVVEVLEAARGELSAGRDETNWSPEEREMGLMVRVQGRVVVSAGRNAYFDTIAQYWMAWDQSSEAWSIRSTQRQGEASRTDAETGFRLAPTVGQPRPKLTVIASDAAPKDWQVPEVYLSQSLAWLLGRLLPRDRTDPQFFTYYFYNARSATPSLTLRYDRWEPTTDGSGNWILATLLGKTQLPDITVYDADGALVRRVLPSGDVTEPTTREALLARWKAQGLRTGSGDR